MPVNTDVELALTIGGRTFHNWKLPLDEQLLAFDEFGKKTQVITTESTTHSGQRISVPTFVNEFWTSKQRAANSLHEVSYRACFKPQLPRFFIQRLSAQGEAVYDPFMGRGTTLVEAALCGRVPFGCDVNPVSALLTCPRLSPPSLRAVEQRLQELDFRFDREMPEDLLIFYHPETLREICALRSYLIARRQTQQSDEVDDWIAMVALNRLTGHSPGFFSVYTLPPNQAVSVVAQRKINEARKQKPPRRVVPAIILKKTGQLLKECSHSIQVTLTSTAPRARVLTGKSSSTPQIENGRVSLVVTSPPFLDVVDYVGDNWLRCWFADIDPTTVAVTTPRKLEHWQQAMTEVFQELWRVLKPGGHVAFEVGEVRGGKVKLEEAVVPCGMAAGFKPLLILINDQKFTKTANCWGVNNNSKGTNTNRIVVFQK
jgi:hypothetical protein